MNFVTEKKKHFYRRYLIYDPLNNFCSFYTPEYIFDNYIILWFEKRSRKKSLKK